MSTDFQIAQSLSTHQINPDCLHPLIRAIQTALFPQPLHHISLATIRNPPVKMRPLSIFGLATLAGMTASAEQAVDVNNPAKRDLPPAAMMTPQLVARVNPVVAPPVSAPKPVPGTDLTASKSPSTVDPLPQPQPPNAGSDNGPPPSVNSPSRSAGHREINSVGFEVLVALAVTAYLL